MFNQFFTKKNIDAHSLRSLKGMFNNDPKFNELYEQLKGNDNYLNNSGRSLKGNNSYIGNSAYNNSNKKSHSLNDTFISHGSYRRKRFNNSSPEEKDISVSKDEDVERKVNSYRLQLNKELISLIETEQQNEKQREIEYNKAKSGKDKTELDKKFSEERQIASKKIADFSR
jgi:hypothetical protein